MSRKNSGIFLSITKFQRQLERLPYPQEISSKSHPSSEILLRLWSIDVMQLWDTFVHIMLQIKLQLLFLEHSEQDYFGLAWYTPVP
jgi:hypothetical protein